MMPLVTMVSITGCAALNAAVASSLLPAVIAASTFLMDVRRRERAATLCSRRLTACLARFSADLMFATDCGLLRSASPSGRGQPPAVRLVKRAAYSGDTTPEGQVGHGFPRGESLGPPRCANGALP